MIAYEDYDVVIYGFAFDQTFADIDMKVVYKGLKKNYGAITDDMIMSCWDETGPESCCWMIVADKYLEDYQMRKILDYILEYHFDNELVLYHPNMEQNIS